MVKGKEVATPAEAEVVVEAVTAKESKAEKGAEKGAGKLEEEGDIAADYLEALLDIADLDGDIDIDVENDRASLAIVGGKLSHLVGRDGEENGQLHRFANAPPQCCDRMQCWRQSYSIRPLLSAYRALYTVPCLRRLNRVATDWESRNPHERAL